MIVLPLYFTAQGKEHLKKWVADNVVEHKVMPEVIEIEMLDRIKTNSIIYDDIPYVDRVEGYKPFCCVSGDLQYRNIFTGEMVTI